MKGNPTVNVNDLGVGLLSLPTTRVSPPIIGTSQPRLSVVSQSIFEASILLVAFEAGLNTLTIHACDLNVNLFSRYTIQRTIYF